MCEAPLAFWCGQWRVRKNQLPGRGLNTVCLITDAATCLTEGDDDVELAHEKITGGAGIEARLSDDVAG
jgi:hypothetical protein